MTRSMLHAVLFDFNGVLVDDEHLHLAGFNAVLSPLGVSLDPETYADRYLGFDDRGAFTAALRDHGRDHDEALIASLIEAKAAVYARLAATELTVFEGASALVRACAERWPVAVVSGALRAEIESALEVMGVRDAVGDIISAEDVVACKPDPEGYLLALAVLGERVRGLDPRRVVAVEDSTAGVVAARGAGVRALAVAHTYTARALALAGADEVRERLSDVDLEALEAVVRR